MLHLVDTGVLLRLVNRAEPAHEAARKSLRQLRLMFPHRATEDFQLSRRRNLLSATTLTWVLESIPIGFS